MDQRVSVITLGVDDLEYSRRFYEALGWQTKAEAGAEVAFFQAGALIVALWDRTKLADDSGVDDDGRFGGVTLSVNVASREEVEEAIVHAEAAGAAITRRPAETFWGGYSGYFVDPDGHPWEIAYNPHWTLQDDGSITLP